MVLLGPHSNEGLQFLRHKNIKVVPATATPLFAEHLRDNLIAYEIDKDNLEFVALDKGSLQQNIKLCQMMDLDPAMHVTAFDKGRKGENVVDASNLIYGDPKGKDVVICDDIIDTFGSIDATVQSLRKKFKCKSVTVMVTHGVLSHPGRANILKALLETHSVDRVIMTDSLPKANYDFEKQREKYPGKLPLIPIAQNLGEMTQYLAEHSYEEIMSDTSPFANFILEPKNKDDVWADFLENTARKDLIVDPKKRESESRRRKQVVFSQGRHKTLRKY